MQDFNYSEFAELIGEKLDVFDANGTKGEVVITDVNKVRPDGDDWHAFRISLKSLDKFSLTQGSYLFRHDKAGECDLFISPKSINEYEAPITRARK